MGHLDLRGAADSELGQAWNVESLLGSNQTFGRASAGTAAEDIGYGTFGEGRVIDLQAAHFPGL